MSKQWILCLFVFLNHVSRSMDNNIVKFGEDGKPQRSGTTQNILNIIAEKSKALIDVQERRLQSSQELQKLTNPRKKEAAKKQLEEIYQQELNIFAEPFIEDMFAQCSEIKDVENKRQQYTIQKTELMDIINSFKTSLWEKTSPETQEELTKRFLPLKYLYNPLSHYDDFASLCMAANSFIPNKTLDLLYTKLPEHTKTSEERTKQLSTICSDISRITKQIALLQTQLKKREDDRSQCCTLLNNDNATKQSIIDKARTLTTIGMVSQHIIQEIISNKENVIKQKEEEIAEIQKTITEYETPKYQADIEKQKEIISLEEKLQAKKQDKNNLQEELDKYKKRSLGATWSDTFKWNNTYGKDMQEWLTQWK